MIKNREAKIITLIYNIYIKKVAKKFNLNLIVYLLKILLPLNKLLKYKG